MTAELSRDATGELSDAQVESLLGAYALDACEPDEVAAIEVVLARRPDLAAEARHLVEVAAWVGAAHALQAPSTLRDDVLAAATARRARPLVSDPVVELYEAESDAFAAAVAALPRGALRVITANGLSARDLVVHMAAQESLFAQTIGRPVMGSVTETDIDARTDAVLTELADCSLDDVTQVWRAAVDTNLRWAIDACDDTADWRGVEMSRDDALVVRAFETWVHAEDLRRVGGLESRVPPTAQLALMADLAGRVLAVSLVLADRVRPGRRARLVLTGDAGGSWVVPMGGAPFGAAAADSEFGDSGRAVDVTVTADAADWCRLVGDRIAPHEISVEVDGDRALADDLLAAAPALATL